MIVKDDQLKPDLAKTLLAAGLQRRQGRPRGRHHLVGRGARDAAGGRGVQEDPDRRAGGRRRDHRRQVEPLHLPHRPQLDAGRAMPPPRPFRQAATCPSRRWRRTTPSAATASRPSRTRSPRSGRTRRSCTRNTLPQNTTDFTASAQRLFDALKDKPGRRSSASSGPAQHPLPKIADLKPERFGIEIAPGGNILPAMAAYKQLSRHGRRDLLLLRLPEEPGERLARGRAPEALQRAAGLLHRRRLRGRIGRRRRRSRRPAAPTPRS